MQVGNIVIALARKEKNQIFLVKKIECKFAFIVDGKRISFFKPKKKNQKHLKIVSKDKFNFTDFDCNDIKINSAIRKFLKVQKERICQEMM